jgi:hypothetical protein
MDELITRVLENLGARVAGPMSLRLLLQPTVAAILAIRAGMQDARTGQPAYFWALLTDSEHRHDLLRDGWKSITKVFLAATALDAVYQIIVLRWVYPGEALLVAFILACVPYLLIRGPINRLMRSPRAVERTHMR